MATFDSKQGLEETTNEDGADDGGPASRSGEDKLRKLLARSRAVAGNADIDDYDGADDRTDMVGPGSFPPMPPASASGSMNVAQPPPMAAPPPRPAPPAHAAPMPPQHSGPLSAPSAAASHSGPMFPPGAAPPFQGQGNTSGIMPMYQHSAPVPLAPSGEFGIVPDIGVQSRDDIPAYEPPSARRRRSIAVGVTVVVGLIAFVVISKLIVDQWVAPGRAVVWMTAGTVLPTLLAGLLLAWPNAAGRASLRDVLVALVPALAMSGGAVFVATSWTQAAIRTQAVAFVHESPEAMGAILEDPDINVAVAGCKRFAAYHEQTDYRALLFASLTIRPDIATKCMGELPEDAQLAIATSLADRWSRELLVDDEKPNETRLCATAGGLGALPLDRASLGARLLQCTLSAPSAKAQECCGTSLGAMVVDSKQWAKHLRESMDFVKDDDTAAGVFAMAFHQKNLTPAQKAFAAEVKFDSPQVQLAALEFACGSIDNGRTGVIRHMQAALEGQCAIDPGGVPTSLAMWREVCFLTLAELESDRTLPPSKTMCAMTQDMSVLSAVETAKRIVGLSHGKDLEGTFARQIDLGYVKVLNELSQPGEDRRDVPSFVSAEDARAAQTNIKSGDMRNENFKFAAPSDDGFQAFMKAYREQKPWENNARQKEAVENIGK